MGGAVSDRDDDGSVDVEAAWADIVAHWDVDQAPEPAMPSSEPAEHRRGHRGDHGGSPEEDWGPARSHVGGDRARDAAEDDAAVDAALDEEGYVPPEPPPLGIGDPLSRMAWAGVLGAPLFFLFAAVFWRSAPTILVLTAVGAFVAGFATLVARLPDRRDDDEDDGAVV